MDLDFDIPAWIFRREKKPWNNLSQACSRRPTENLPGYWQDVAPRSRLPGNSANAQNGLDNKLLDARDSVRREAIHAASRLGSLRSATELTGAIQPAADSWPLPERQFEYSVALRSRDLGVLCRCGWAKQNQLTSLATQEAICTGSRAQVLEKTFRDSDVMRASAVTNLPYSPLRSPVTASQPSAFVSNRT